MNQKLEPDRAPVEDLLRQGLEELGVPVREERLDRLVKLSFLLAHWAERINLTGHREPELIAHRLILDAAALMQTLPPFASVADLGSGAGFPGLPIAILSEATVTLVEAREKRHHFQRAAVRELGLPNAHPLRGRIEDLIASPHDLVVAQAVGPWREVVGWMLPWAKKGGALAIPVGRQAPSSSLHQDAVEEEVLRYRVPLGGPERQIWLARRA